MRSNRFSIIKTFQFCTKLIYSFYIPTQQLFYVYVIREDILPLSFALLLSFRMRRNKAKGWKSLEQSVKSNNYL